MTYKQALIGQPYAKRVNDVLEKLEWVCSRCTGDGIRLSGGYCPRCDGLGKIHYSWQPQIGEWYITKGKLMLISEFSQTVWAKTDLSKSIKPIPILEWEEIQAILVKAGILLRLRETPSGWVPPTKFYCDVTILHRDAARVKEFISLSVANSRTKAVYEAVLALEKKMK